MRRLWRWLRRKPEADPVLAAWLLDAMAEGQEHWARYGEPPPPRRIEIRPLGGHLEDGAPFQRCSACGRSTWDVAQFGEPCNLPQPDGLRCAGVFGSSLVR